MENGEDRIFTIFNNNDNEDALKKMDGEWMCG
jgi:hypothetical protein